MNTTFKASAWPIFNALLVWFSPVSIEPDPNGTYLSVYLYYRRLVLRNEAQQWQGIVGLRKLSANLLNAFTPLRM